MSNERILIVEDEHIIAHDLRSRLHAFGYFVIAIAARGVEAVRLAGSHHPDLVLMDIYLKGDMDGVEAAGLIRREHEIPVVFITAHSDDRTLKHAKQAEPYGYILKPFVDRELRTTIEMALYKAETERKLRENEARYRAIVEDQMDLVVRFQPDSRITFVNDAFCRFFSTLREVFIGMDISSQASPQMAELARVTLANATPAESAASFETELRMSDGVHWIQWRSRAIYNNLGRMVEIQSVGRDITLQKEYEAQLAFKAFHDNLTGLANRSLFLNRLQHVLDRYRWPQSGLSAVLFLDIDHFKLVNDSYGHQAGDAFLVQTARRLEECLRPGDTVARFGGDEFAILLEDIGSVEDALIVAGRIGQKFTVPILIEGQEIYASTSIGITDTARSSPDPQSILRDADIALYQAKEKGRGRCEIFNAEMHVEILSTVQRNRELHRAIENSKLSLTYLPVVSLKERRVAAVEAQICWQRSGETVVLDSDTIASLLDSSVVRPLTQWLFNTVCAEIKLLQASSHPHLLVVVNTTISQLSLPDLPDMIQAALCAGGVPAGALELQINESVVAHHLPLVGHSLEKLGELGVQISLDRFGCHFGYLSQLERYKIRRIKIGAACLTTENEDRSRMIERGSIGIARSFNLEVVGGDVAGRRQIDFLRGENCEKIQGPALGQPLPVDNLILYLAQESSRIAAALE